MTTKLTEEIRSFLENDALPLWSTTGVHPNGCFVEYLDLTARPVDPGYTRVRVQARQIYAFSHASVFGLFDGRDLVSCAIDFFISSAWLGPRRGWAKTIATNGSPLDDSYDLYDVAFALLALAYAYRALGDERCLKIAHETLDFLTAEASSDHGGFHNDAGRSQPRQQNPHMHFVEAMNAWTEFSGGARFAEEAESILRLFETRFIDARTGALREYFDERWEPVASPQGRIVEPGHQFEWAWILGVAGRLSGQPRLQSMRKLIESGLKGYNPASGLTVDQLDVDGAVLAPGHRLWPQTEAIKASLAAYEFLGDDTFARVETICRGLFKAFLAPAPKPGTWIDHFNPSGERIVDKVPASSLYHLTLAFLEVLRVCERVPGKA